MFSKSCEYAIRAAIFIALNCERDYKVGKNEIAAEIASPVAFLAKILQKLVKANIIKSTKGVGGGFEIAQEKLSQIKLTQIVLAIDGDSIFTRCGLGLKHCSEVHPCSVHEKFKFVKQDLTKLLDDTSLADMVLDLKRRNTFLKSD